MAETAQHQPEALANPHAGLAERVKDPSVGLHEVLAEAGLEGLQPEERLGLIENATLDDFMTVVDALHRKVAPDHSHEPHPEAVKFVGRTGEVSSHAAQPEERAAIMGYALEVAKQVAQKYREEGGSLDDALQRCGNLAAFGVGACAYLREWQRPYCPYAG